MRSGVADQVIAIARACSSPVAVRAMDSGSAVANPALALLCACLTTTSIFPLLVLLASWAGA